MDAELSTEFKSAVVIDEEARAPMEPTTEPSPYSSPFITLCVGPDSAKQVTYSVHQDVLLHIPFFKAALRPDAFIEGAENKITFEEEDPALFGKLVEFIYVGDFSSRSKHAADSYSVQRILPESEEELYDFRKHGCGLACGTHISTTKTHKLFETTVLLLCIADRYGMQDLVGCCLNKLEEFPIGTKEVSVLAKHVLENIHEGNEQVYCFLQVKFALFRSRLDQCGVFQELQKSDDILLIKGLLKLMTPSYPLTGAHTGVLREATQFYFAICDEDVTVEGSVAHCNGEREWSNILFGAALKGEILVTYGQVDDWGFFLGGNPAVCSPESWLCYPASSFELLSSVTWDTKESKLVTRYGNRGGWGEF